MVESTAKRKFSRIDFRIVATVRMGPKQFVGAVGNLSLGGIFLLTDQNALLGEEAEISIALDDQPENGVEMIGRVARVTEEGIAFNFEKIDFDSYIHLKNLVALNTGDEGLVHEEMVDHLLDVHINSAD
jgi:Tfp pilus assembly protein PilZ